MRAICRRMATCLQRSGQCPLVILRSVRLLFVAQWGSIRAAAAACHRRRSVISSILRSAHLDSRSGARIRPRPCLRCLHTHAHACSDVPRASETPQRLWRLRYWLRRGTCGVIGAG